VTGFGAFESVERNPSGELALALAADPPPGVAIEAVRLPVTFRGAPQAMDEALAALAPIRPDLLLSLGVHPGSSFRLETRARARMAAGRPDNAGVMGQELDMPDGPDLATELRLGPLADSLRSSGAPEVEVSTDAGGFVCERIFRHGLELGRRLAVPALFLHVPPISAMSLEDQLPIVRTLAVELADLSR